MNSQLVSRRILALFAIAILLPFAGCNSSQKASEVAQPKTSTVVDTVATNPWRAPQLLRSLDTDSTPIVSITISPDSKTIAASSISDRA